jgi:hypothetical protein
MRAMGRQRGKGIQGDSAFAKRAQKFLSAKAEAARTIRLSCGKQRYERQVTYVTPTLMGSLPKMGVRILQARGNRSLCDRQ